MRPRTDGLGHPQAQVLGYAFSFPANPPVEARQRICQRAPCLSGGPNHGVEALRLAAWKSPGPCVWVGELRILYCFLDGTGFWRRGLEREPITVLERF